MKINNKSIKGLTVEVKYGNVDKALRKLKKNIEEDGRLEKARYQKNFTKPAVARRLAKKAAVLRQKREAAERNRIK